MREMNNIINSENLWAFMSPIAIVLTIFIVISQVSSCEIQRDNRTFEREQERQDTIRLMVEQGWSADEIRCVTGQATELFCEYRGRGEFDKDKENVEEWYEE